MRKTRFALACGVVLLAGCSHHHGGESTALSSPTVSASDVPYGWHADALKQALDADTGEKKPYTCLLDFGYTTPPQPSAAVTIPGLIERVDANHATVEASSPELAEKAIHAAVFIGTVRDCEAPVVLRPVDASFPADKYAALSLDPISALGNYYALTGTPVPYDKEAATYDQAYMQTTDTFKRHDLLPAFQAKLDQAVATAKANSEHVRVSFSTGLGHYDFNAHTFKFKIPFDQKVYLYVNAADGMGAQSDVSITFADSPTFNSVTITDEAKARKIENAVTQAGGSVNVDVDAQVVGTKESHGLRTLILAPIALHAESGNITGPHAHLFDIP